MGKKRKYQELYDQLTSWFTTQTKWETKRAFAAGMGIPNTQMEHYFRGDAFPKGEVRRKLYEETRSSCLAPEQPDFFENKNPGTPQFGSKHRPRLPCRNKRRLKALT
jgi:hypothetical protein